MFLEFDPSSLGDQDEKQFGDMVVMETNYILLNARINTRIECHRITYGSQRRQADREGMFVHLLAERYSSLAAATEAALLLKREIEAGRFIVVATRIQRQLTAHAWSWKKSDIAAYVQTTTLEATTHPTTVVAMESTSSSATADDSASTGAGGGGSKDDSALIIGLTFAALFIVLLVGAVLVLQWQNLSRATNDLSHEKKAAQGPLRGSIQGSTVGSLRHNNLLPSIHPWHNAGNYQTPADDLLQFVQPERMGYAFVTPGDPYTQPGVAYASGPQRGSQYAAPNPQTQVASNESIHMADMLVNNTDQAGLLDVLMGRPSVLPGPGNGNAVDTEHLWAANESLSEFRYQNGFSADPLSNPQPYLDITGEFDVQESETRNKRKSSSPSQSSNHYYPAGGLNGESYFGFNDVANALSEPAQRQSGTEHV